MFYLGQRPVFAQNFSAPCPLLGDTNTCDGIVNILDFSYISLKFGSSDPKADTAADGLINILDYIVVSNNFGKVFTPTNIPVQPTAAPAVALFQPDFSGTELYDTYENGIPVPAQSAVNLGIPECPPEMHNTTQWHPLYVPPELITFQMDALLPTDMTKTGCHYNHEHKDNPHLLDDVLGTELYTWAQGEISYPWQTFSGGNELYPVIPSDPKKMENHLKHTGYGWVARKNISCTTDPCITDFRIQSHFVQSPVDAVVRFHSFYAEVRVKHTENQYGFIKRGGWIDFGHLMVNDVVQFVPGSPAQVDAGKRRAHGDTSFATWYGTNGSPYLSFDLLTSDIWSKMNETQVAEYINTGNINVFSLFCRDGSCPQNGSTLEPHAIALRTERDAIKDSNENVQYVFLDNNPDVDIDNRIGILAIDAFTDRYGYISRKCTAVSIDCVPLKISNMPIITYMEGSGELREYDVSPPGAHWIQYPY